MSKKRESADSRAENNNLEVRKRYMKIIRSNKAQFEYDIHSLIKEFYQE